MIPTMLPLGVIARTQEHFGNLNLPVAAEITHHQIVVATALASNATLFYSGLLHDILKPALHFEKHEKRWRWKHLSDVKINGKRVSVKDVLRSISFPQSLDVDIDELIHLVESHHDPKDADKNPIGYVEKRDKLGIPLIEATILPSKDFSKMGLYVCLETAGLNHPYHYFILTLIYYGLKSYLNKEVYGKTFKSLGLRRLTVDYYFGNIGMPKINYEDKNGTLSLSYFIPSTEFKGLHIRHEYSDDIEFNISGTSDNVTFSFNWSDVLVYMVPHIDLYKNKISFKVVCVIPGSVSYHNGKAYMNEEAEKEFENKVNKILELIIKDLKIDKSLIDYLEEKESGDHSCLFCGKKTNYKYMLGKKFTDYPRIRGGSIDHICPLCYVGSKLEEDLRTSGPIFAIPLAGEPIEVHISRDFYQKYGELINTKEGVIPSIIGYSTLQLLSNAWYISLLKKIELKKIEDLNITWAKAYSVRAKKDVNDLYFRFFISRKVLLYPLEIKIRPRAIVSSYGEKNKKFVLNTDLLEGYILWKGKELELTEEQLDALEPILKDIKNIRQVVESYNKVVSLYGLR